MLEDWEVCSYVIILSLGLNTWFDHTIFHVQNHGLIDTEYWYIRAILVNPTTTISIG